MQQGFDMQQLIKLARSPAGQQLMAALSKHDGAATRDAAALAASGDLEQAKQAISGLLENEEIRRLLKQLGGQP